MRGSRDRVHAIAVATIDEAGPISASASWQIVLQKSVELLGGFLTVLVIN